MFRQILKAQPIQLHPGLSETLIDEALARLTERRYAMSRMLANREIYSLIRDGIPVEYEGATGQVERAAVKVIDFDKLKPRSKKR